MAQMIQTRETKRVPIVCIVGTSGVGKTFVMARLVAELKRRGHLVATVKHDVHGFDIDHEGKDSWRHAQAGSDAVVISSPQKFAMIRKVDHDSSLAEISELIGPGYDIILAEGYKRSRAPKIEVHRKEMDRPLLCNQEELIALATDEIMALDTPQYSLDDAEGLVDLIEEHYISHKKKEMVPLSV